MSIVNMELYKVFYLAATTGSLSQAAKAMFLTQPSVSHAIKQLEENLGVTLLSRTSKGVELTKDGALLFPYIEQAYSLIMTGESKIAEIKSLSSGELRIGGSDSLLKHYLFPYLETYRNAFPGIGIHLTHGTTPELIANLKEGHIDLGVVRLPIVDPQLDVKEGIQLQDCFVAGASYAELKGQVLTLEQILQYPIILFSRNSRARMAVTDLFRSYGYALKPEIELGSVDLLIEFARKGLGISFVTREFASKELEEGTLFEVKLDVELPPSQVGIMTLRHIPLSKAAAQFLQLLSPDKT